MDYWTGLLVSILWVLFVCVSTGLLLALGTVVIVVAICVAIHHLKRRRLAHLAEKLLEVIPAVPYQPPPLLLPADAGADDDDGREPSSCVICMTPFEAGDTCLVLPGCSHMYHRPCIGEWLRRKCNCPLCRADLAAVATTVRVRAPDDDACSAAELMV